MNKYFFVLLLFLPSVAKAGPVSVQQAYAKAKEFMAGKGRTINPNASNVRSRAKAHDNGNNEYYYVFNAEQQGFVIVSGDDRTPAILGYSELGNFDDDNLPPNMEVWLKNYVDQIEYIQKYNIQPSISKRRTPRESISPMIKTKWNQTAPYNNDLPLQDGKKCVAGCLPTAVAQMMYYYQYPLETSKDIPGFHASTINEDIHSLPPTTFDWSKMALSYNGSESTEQEEAVSRLFKYCSVAMQTNYSSSQSPTLQKNVYKIKDYFGYSDKMMLVGRDFDDDIWHDLLYDHLKNGYPVLYCGGYPKSHAFILDGIDADGLYSVNWGWSGHFDGYFMLDNLIPDPSLIFDNYSNNQVAAFCFYPSEATGIDVPIRGIKNIFYLLINDSSTATVIANPYSYYQKSITIPETIEENGRKYVVSSIANHAFKYCNRLKAVSLPSTLISIGDYAFNSCTGLKELVIPEGVETIGNYAFQGCSGLTSMTIPASLKNLGQMAFWLCDNITSLNVAQGNPYFDSRDSCNSIIETATNKLVQGCANSTIPKGITTIGDCAFYSIKSLSTINIPEGVDSICDLAFFYCIGLPEITLPSSIRYLGHQAISSCESLTDLYCLAEEIPETKENTFSNTKVENVVLHVPAKSIDLYKSTEPWKNFKEIVPIQNDQTSTKEILLKPSTPKDIFDLNGQRTNVHGKGVRIIKQSDGRTRKVIK